MSEDTVDMRPSLGETLDGYSRYSYKPETALAEFVDNSTQSYFDNVPQLQAVDGDDFQLQIVINYNPSLRELRILDNAYGMDHDTFKDALKISKRPKNTGGRSEYGYGMKTAASWFGKRWIVRTSTVGDRNLYVADIDIPTLVKTGQTEITITREDVDPDYHGTEIIIRDLKQPISNANLNKLKEDLTSIYRRDISGGHISITVDGDELQYEGPKPLVDYDDDIPKTWKTTFKDDVVFDGQHYPIKGTLYILSKGKYDFTGFTLLRRGRVIVGGNGKGYKPKKIFGASNSPVSLRLYGEIDLDDWPINQAKDGFDWELSGLEDEFIEKMFQISTDLGYIAKAKANKGDGTESKPTPTNGGAIIDNPRVPEPPKPLVTDVPTSKPEPIVEPKPAEFICKPYDINIELLKTKYLINVYFEEHEGGDWMTITNSGEEERKIVHVVINTKSEFVSQFKNDKAQFNLVKMFAIIIAVAESHSKYLATSNDGSVSPHDVRLTISRIIDEISADKEKFNVLFGQE